jgi:hypothetical protein
MGDALFAYEFGSKPASDSEKREVARRWFEVQKARLQEVICGNKLIRELLFAKNQQERNVLFASVIDALTCHFGSSPVPVAVISAKLIHYGLDRLCEGTDSAGSKQDGTK